MASVLAAYALYRVELTKFIDKKSFAKAVQ